MRKWRAAKLNGIEWSFELYVGQYDAVFDGGEELNRETAASAGQMRNGREPQQGFGPA
jgi:hypothetical protein